jgi:hypothetical protein
MSSATSPRHSTSCAAKPLQDEIERLAPPADTQLAQAERLLSDFAAFWEAETSPAERHRLLTTLFERAWAGQRPDRRRQTTRRVRQLLQTASQTPKRRSGMSGVMSESDGGRTRSGHRIEIRL